jgi:MFS family permease
MVRWLLPAGPKPPHHIFRAIPRRSPPSSRPRGTAPGPYRFLEAEHKLSPHAVGIIAVIYNIGAICGGILFGTLSERYDGRRCIVIAALLSLPVIPLWAFSHSPEMLAIGAFLMQFTVQGAWGIVPSASERVIAE